MIKELWRFLGWLDKHERWKWEKPRGMDEIKRNPIKLPEDQKATAFQTNHKETYTPEQLAILCKHTDELGRALIGLCVNCAFGASEVGRWSTELYAINQAHPHAHRIGIASTDADSWVTGNRPKTGVYGEHLLWREVAQAVAPFLDGREVLPITRTGSPWYKTHASNPQTKFTRWWSDLTARVQRKHDKAFPHLPFGSLRDTLPDVLRRNYSDDVASLCLQHGKIGDDDLLNSYANLPFRRLFDATRELADHFRPMLDAVAAK
jgi:hypothetical protein